MYLWRRRASPTWWAAHKRALREGFGQNLAVIEQPNRKTLQIEITCESPKAFKEFGGSVRKLPRDWLKRFARDQKTKPIRVGHRELVIPAGAAFGTGEHATTSMCLTMLRQCFDTSKLDWSNQSSFRRRVAPVLRPTNSVVDLGTGSGILALAARILGAKRVLAIDNDPIAIRTARENAQRNSVHGIRFVLGDARRTKTTQRFDLLTANLFSELLIEALPNWLAVLKEDARLILSGILRSQERDVVRVLRANDLRILRIRRRGKWIAMLSSR